jgi:glycosyltransferase involved in cell wall biosynthesis
MRILLFPSAYAPAVGGVEQLTADLAHHLVERGHTVEVWTNRHPLNLPDRELIEGILVRRFAMTLPGENLRSAQAWPIAALRALRALGRATRAFSPDLVHVQCFSVNGVYASALSKMFGMPLIVSLQGETVMDDHDIYDQSLSLRIGLRAGLMVADMITGCSQFTINDAVARFGLATEDGIVVPNGINLNARTDSIPLKLPFERFVLTYGRMVKKKGFDLLVDAFAPLAGRNPDLGLVIGGDGSARAALTEQIHRLGLTGRVVLPGKLSRGEVAWATHRASAFVLPSRVEPFGIVVLEAMDAGVPVVVSAHGGTGEIIRDGIDGVVVDPLDRNALASALEQILATPGPRERYIPAARARSREFGWESITDHYVALYECAIARAGPGRASRHRTSRPHRLQVWR